MTSQASKQALSLYDAARAMGVKFTNENAPQDKFVDANGMRFHYLEWGNPGNPPMLLLHGFAQTCHSWDFVALGFSDNYRVIVLDQRGHGDSDWASDGDYSPETQQKDISGVVNELGLGRVHTTQSIEYDCEQDKAKIHLINLVVSSEHTPKAGILNVCWYWKPAYSATAWIPAFAGMTI